MSLYDLMLCACGHARHKHAAIPTRDIMRYPITHYGHCRECDCKGFLETHTHGESSGTPNLKPGLSGRG